ncbi:major facilitator superfamily domain-containing protein [Staphylotrichum tortipilum]|uniref:Major facilitator superfamily domain-containing protein n=1 Tax=Staphylotrichum tortipilum TaxID=2831512 RepID=A0AAN6MJ74_9PEZI|nr:major facilitator superfamily domain-containing protein [Staphylotrichum longicolle]
MPYSDADPGTSAAASSGDSDTTPWPPYRDSLSDDTRPRTGLLIDIPPSSTPDNTTTLPDSPAERRPNPKPATASWRDLPRRDQLIVIALARLSEPLVQTSIQSYMFYQLKWFDPTLPDSVISSQAGILHASFTAAQFITAMMWGRVADSSLFGRKTVLMIGLGGTLLSCIGFAFSTSFWQALVFRSIGGITNGNVGVLRTMISETIREKKYQSRAFLLLPMTFNIGVIIGPILGGVLSNPAESYPDLFGNIEFFKRFPYATPNLVSAFFLFCALMGVWLRLEETLESRLEKRDRGLELGRKLQTWFSRRSKTPTGYTPLPGDPDSSPSTSPPSPTTPPLAKPTHRRRYTHRLPFRRIFTPNVTTTLTASFLLAFHLGTFNSLWFVFLSTPVYDPARGAEDPSALPRHLPFIFTGGLGLRPREVGFAMAVLGGIGITLQLLVYPKLAARLGTVASWRIFLVFFPVAYFLVPFLSLVPGASGPPHAKDGAAVWVAIVAVIALQVIGRTFALPAQTILVNNCSPHPSVLGTVHGIGQSVSSFARTVGPVVGGFLYGRGLAVGVVGVVFWGLSAIAVGTVVASLFVREGDGHEIWLEGDEEDEEGLDS